MSRSQPNVGLSISPQTPGFALLRLLFETASARGHSHVELAEHIPNVSPSYFSHLRSGRVTADKIARETMEHIATYLEMPVLGAMILADQVLPSHFSSPERSFEGDVDRALSFVATDPNWGVFFTGGVYDLPVKLKAFLIFAYEEASGTRLLARQGMEDLIEGQRRFREERPLDEGQTDPTGKK